ncbi:uncharacterized protein zgc:193811 [Engraulis encrasicolus]|uniref:uncharacterized protein zgc:193811 n=1 Tax=Engraulis encrasicolus TaxID=184585 RepID=UPI002FD6E86E
MDQRRAWSAGVTSTGIGHKFVPHPPFQSNPNLRKGPLPRSLDGRLHTTLASSLIPTSHMMHNRKPLTGPLADIKQPVAPPHSMALTMTDVNRKVKDCWAMRVLPVPTSEMRDHYRGHPAYIRLPIEHNHELMYAVDRSSTAPSHFLSTSLRDHRLFDSAELAAPYNGPGKPLPRLHPPKAPFSFTSYSRLQGRFLPLRLGGYTTEYRGNYTSQGMPRPLPHRLHAQHVSS